MITTPFRRSGEFLAQGAIQGAKLLGERLIGGSPFNLPDSAAGYQEAIRKFDGRLGVVTQLMESEDAETLEARAEVAAYSMVDEGMVDANTEVELRPLIPEDALRRGEFIQKTLAGMGLLRHFLRQYDVEAIPNGFPITPTKTEDSPVNPRKLWGAIGSELEDFRRQIGPRHRLAMLAIAETPYAKRIFDDQLHVDEQAQYFEDGRLMVVRSVGDDPSANLLMPPRSASPAEKRLLPESTSPPA